jgi:F-type H+-transporting ATPase subunit b
MNINATIFGQMITFGIFVWINMKFIWPKIMSVLTERENKILQGLQAAEQGVQKLDASKRAAKEKEAETKKYCAQMIAEAKKQAEQLLELAVIQAKQKGEEIIKNTHLDIQKEHIKLQKALQEHLADLIISGAEKIIETRLDKQQHNNILIDISNKIYGAK